MSLYTRDCKNHCRMKDVFTSTLVYLKPWLQERGVGIITGHLALSLQRIVVTGSVNDASGKGWGCVGMALLGYEH